MTVVRNLNDKNAQFQKQLDNVIREANNEIGLLSSKVHELEKNLELEHRKVRDVQEASRERDKEYQKLKVQFDKVKRKALLAPGTTLAHGTNQSTAEQAVHASMMNPAAKGFGGGMDLGTVIGGMEANGIQRTPLLNRTMDIGGGAGSFVPQQSLTTSWQQHQQNLQNAKSQRKARPHKHKHRPSHSDASDSANEVENQLFGMTGSRSRMHFNYMGMDGGAMGRGITTAPNSTSMAAPGARNVFAPQLKRRHASGFRPAMAR